MADWTPDLTLNHELLDTQHLELFRTLSAAAEAIDGPAAAAEAALAELAEALALHLATEERLMDEALYPERARHRSAHELFMAGFVRMREELRSLGPTPAVVDWLRKQIPEWLRFHIRVNDLPFGAYLGRRRARSEEGRTAKDRGRRLS